ncbi:uncharacterized protein M437DRAFT_47302 [Aureobasidium melanogenum CBS 110374]|uniref:Uncharacterized protein n=1 Tax=Aureobasidium melanogenum (strain CBS 110374) TaxID=1043003 RepID=A0A074VTB8_AURM1|nr:uncharacterized protein M437DRAFT_47302 [Aureobasidium melanogenum CBS 110374]KEQ63653.1 hypothetical protein M437DRAFT_47302 [Aureobasidium melanogenum CBS 110374]
MSTKRKRSNGSLFTTPAVEAPSPTPFFSSPVLLPNFFAQSKGYDPQSPSGWKQSHQQSNTYQEEDTQSQILHSRTRKRYRDGRPEESQIHGSFTSRISHLLSRRLHTDSECAVASTVQKLFSAQRAHPHASPIPSYPQTQDLPQDAPAQRSTLHSFWQLPQSSQLQVQHGTPAPTMQQEVVMCEGCDRVLVPEYGMDTLEAETACRGCGKCVCDTCAITAEVRLCLDCAMQG